MPSWNQVLNEINATASDQQNLQVPADRVRRKYLAKLHEYTHRNIIAYYSGWLHLGSVAGIDINDLDMNGFMSVINGMDCEKGLDLILHTPGGAISTAEHLVSYLKKKFGKNIRAVIPQIAMSAGTMIAFSCKEIVMGKQSCLGPIDPQCNGVSALRVLEEFNHAIKDAQDNPSSIPFWQTIIGKYHPTFIDSCGWAISRSKVLVEDWLKANMFSEVENAKDVAEKVVDLFTRVGEKMDHDKHIDIDDCKEAGLKIIQMEENQTFQDLILTVHHAFMHTMSQFPVVKAIENHNGVGFFKFQR